MDRTEHDPLGEKKVPTDAYYGIHTQRAKENFPISGLTTPRHFIHALGLIKLACAKVNMNLDFLEKGKANAIIRASAEVAEGKFDKEFVVDYLMAGAGTPWNMNANEVIANRALELVGKKKGDYAIIHPNDHVNMGQSTNDVFPAAIRLMTLFMLPSVIDNMGNLEKSFLQKAKEFKTIIKSGRTHLQDAVPIFLGQEFHSYATCIHKHRERLIATQGSLLYLGLGGTAIGTGCNAHPQQRELVMIELRRLTKLPLEVTADGLEATNSLGDVAMVSAVQRQFALELTRICNDLRLLCSGPTTGFNELVLPAVEPGSSIMPGKVNPSMVEMMNQINYQVIGCDHVVQMGLQAGQLELNVMMPVMAYNLWFALLIMDHGLHEFTSRCVQGIKAKPEVCRTYFESSMGIATMLNPYIGYEKAAALEQEAQRTGKTIRELVLEKKILPKEKIDALLDPESLTKPNRKK